MDFFLIGIMFHRSHLYWNFLSHQNLKAMGYIGKKKNMSFFFPSMWDIALDPSKVLFH